MNVWWCNQSDQWDVERPEGVVCSHDSSRYGGNNRYRKTVGEARRGDLIVHYRKPDVVSFSRAKEDGTFYGQLPLLQGEDYEAGWRFRTEYFDLKHPVHRESFDERLIPHRTKHYPINRLGHVQQGYFFPFDLKGLREVLSTVSEDLPDWLDVHRPGQPLIPEEIVDPTTLFEGASSTVTVNAYERNAAARNLCIEHYGARCVVCKVDRGEHYGEAAEGLIHVHHVVPLSEIGERYLVDPIQDLCPVCPNCHAVIHHRSPPYSVDEVRKMLEEKM
jgi:hypothetical protein